MPLIDRERRAWRGSREERRLASVKGAEVRAVMIYGAMAGLLCLTAVMRFRLDCDQWKAKERSRNQPGKGTSYKACVRAWKYAKGVKTATGKASPTRHAITGGYNGKRCDAKSVRAGKPSVEGPATRQEGAGPRDGPALLQLRNTL